MAFTDDAFLQAAGLSLAAYGARPLPTGEDGWTPLPAGALGLRPLGQAADGIYRMTPGVYVQTDGLSDAAAHVYVNEEDNTLALAFRGANERLDLLDQLQVIDHYARFEPLMAAVADYVDDPANDIDQVLVTGHSLGASMTTTAMIDQGWTNDARVLGIAIASDGTDQRVADLAPAEVTNLINVLHEDDRTLLGEVPFAGLLTFMRGVAPLGAEPNERVGIDLWIDELPNPDVAAGLILDTRLFDVTRQPAGTHALADYTEALQILHAAGVLDPAVLAEQQEWRFTIDPRTGQVVDPDTPQQPTFLDLMRFGTEVERQFELRQAEVEQAFTRLQPDVEREFARAQTDVEQAFARVRPDLEREFAGLQADAEQSGALLRASADDLFDTFG